MKHLGDITQIDWLAVEPVDVVTGGSPCQDLSVAGKRAGLAGERSGLYMEQIKCVKELREADVLRGRTGEFIRPRYMVWENVPGAFSSGKPKGADFAAVIEEIIKVAEQDAYVCVLPPSGGWTKSGCYYDRDGRWSIAWRVHDAQFWGVPQRRKRISLVADFGGLSAPEILFERKGLSGNFEQSGAEASLCLGEECSPTLSTTRTPAALHNSVCYGISSYDSNAMKSPNPHSGIYEADTSRTLDLNGGNPACNQGGMAVVCLNDQGGSVMNVSEDVSGCLRAQEHGHQPIVATKREREREHNGNHRGLHESGSGGRQYPYGEGLQRPADSFTQQPLCIEMTSTKNTVIDDGICPTLTARMGTGGNQVNAVLEEI